MCSYIVSDQEIEKAERDVLGGGLHFNDKQKYFLKCLDSCQLQAYAGTGKTSVIVGKLHILAQKKVWQNGRGVCVISHTNVAVDEIKKHVAKHYPEAMGYPNFVGTIQEFVNKFLFVPFLANNGLQIKFQDEYRYLDFGKFPDVQNRIIKHRNSIGRQSNPNRDAQLRRFNEAINNVLIKDDKICATDDKGEITPILDNFKKLPTKNCDTTTITSAFKTCIKDKHSAGNFLFKESFLYGLEHLEKNPILKRIICQRFQFVFLDEAQDCADIQLKLLNELFQNNASTVFQQVGDENQDISDGQWTVDHPLYLGDSARFGQNITEFINKFKIDVGPGVTGNSEETKRLLLVYAPGKEQDVLPRFSEYLRDENIPIDPEKGYFAISHKHDQLCVYYSNYSEKVAKNKTKKFLYRFNDDFDYVGLINRGDTIKYGSQFVSHILFNLLYKHFKEKGKSWLEVRDLLRDSDVSNDFRFLVINTCRDILENNSIGNIQPIADKLNSILGENKISFASQGTSGSSASTPTNQYIDQNGTVLNVGTIHSVKGQTHIATLFFSNNEYSKQDVKHALDNTASHTPRFKKLIYVASSRAKYLFAFAIPKSAYDQLSDKTIFNGFDRKDI